MELTAVIVDDHAGFRDQAAELLRAAGYEVVGSCPDGRSAVDAISALRPDLVLLDVQLPDTDGFLLISQLDAVSDGATIVLTSTREAADYGGRVPPLRRSLLSADGLAVDRAAARHDRDRNLPDRRPRPASRTRPRQLATDGPH